MWPSLRGDRKIDPLLVTYQLFKKKIYIHTDVKQMQLNAFLYHYAYKQETETCISPRVKQFKILYETMSPSCGHMWVKHNITRVYGVTVQNKKERID